MSQLNVTPIFAGASASEIAGGAEVSAYANGRLFILGAKGFDVRDPATGNILYSVDTSALGDANSIAVRGDKVVVALAAQPKTEPGQVAFFDVTDEGATLAGSVTVGALPDMVTFTPDGSRVLVANEGEPSVGYAVDPEGSVSVIDVATLTVKTAGLTQFNDRIAELTAQGVRQVAPGQTFAQDAEPEYIAVTADGTKAYVVLQEVNAVAVLDLSGEEPVFTSVLGLGYKGHSLPGNGMDASDRDGPGNNALDGNIQNWPVFGMYQPDGIATFEFEGRSYFVTANEGDSRAEDMVGPAFDEEARVKDLTLDPEAFPNWAELQTDDQIGRLNVTTTMGDVDGDGDYDALYAFGARSFTIWTEEDGRAVQTFDSGALIEQIIFEQFPALWDDARSDNKGPEPEHVTLGTVNGELYAFVGLERSNAVMSFHIENPTSATFAGLIHTDGDQAPEVFTFIPAESSVSGEAELVVASEASSTVSSYILTPQDLEPAPVFRLQILHASDLEAGIAATTRQGNFAAIVDKFEDEVANSLTLISGDAWIPGPYYAAEGDASIAAALREFYGNDTQAAGGARVSVAFLNAIEADAVSFGNHEFDLGPNAIADAIRPSGSNNGANFPYISANLTFPGGNPLNPLVTQGGQDAATLAGKVAPWVTTDVNGETVAIIGVTTQILAAISSVGNTIVETGPNNDTDLLAAYLQPIIDDASLVTNKIILMSHLQQYGLETELAGKLSGVDIIISGGSNALFADATDTLRPGHVAAETYPMVLTDRDGNTTLQVNTDGEYSYVGRLVVEFDADGHIIVDSLDPAVNGAYATTDEMVEQIYADELADADPTNDPFAEGSKGAQAQALADAVAEVINAKDGNVLGYTEVFLEGRRDGVRSQETNLGNLTADANRWYAEQLTGQEVQVSIKNGGGIRAEIGTFGTGAEAEPLPPPANPGAGKLEGGISQLDIENSLRFNNALSVVTVTVAGLEKIIEHAVASVAPGATPGSFGQFGGLAFSFDPTAQAQKIDNATGVVTQEGLRVQSLALIDEDGNVIQTLMQNGAIIVDPNQDIRMVTLSFLIDPNGANLTGGDGYPIGLFAKDRVDLLDTEAFNGAADFAADGTEQDAFAEYLKAKHGTQETAYTTADTPQSGDERVQNLSEREDSLVLPPAEGAVLDFTVWQDALGLGDDADRGFDASAWRGALLNLDYEVEEGVFASSANDDPTGEALARFLSQTGDVSVTGAAFDNAADLAGRGELLNLVWNGDAATLTHSAAWNTVKTAVVNEFTGDALTLNGFVHNVVELGGRSDDIALTLDGAKRGFIELGSGDDVIEIGAVSNVNEWSRLFQIATGDGNDTIRFVDPTDAYGQKLVGAAGTRSLIDLGDGDDRFFGGAGNDTVFGGTGNNVLDGGAGFDIAMYGRTQAEYDIVENEDGSLSVSSIDGTDLLFNFEQLTFADNILAI